MANKQRSSVAKNTSATSAARDAQAGASRAGAAAAEGAQPLAVSVVIPAYNCASRIAACLESLRAQTYPRERIEILVVDDGSTDGTSDAARRCMRDWRGSFRVIEQTNGGPASARNAGIRAAQGEIVAFIDSDCVAAPDWLAALAHAFATSDAAGVGGPLVNVAPAGWVSRYLDTANFFRHRTRGGAVEYLITGNAAFRRSALRAMGGFTEREGAWGEDADLSFRLTQAGYHLLLTQQGAVTHFGSPGSTRGLVKELYRYGYGNAILSPQWQNGRRAPVEGVRHLGAALLAPALALSYARRVGLAAALSFWPLIVLEHGAFTVGLARGVLRRGRSRAGVEGINSGAV